MEKEQEGHHIYLSDYQSIINIAQEKAEELKPGLPPLPSQEELEPFQGIMYARDKSLVAAVRRHQEAWGEPALGHGFEHLEWVAINGAYVAARECEERGVTGNLRDEIIQRTWRLGLVHDLQRWRGFQKIHAIEGSKETRQLLIDMGIEDAYLPDQVLVHDDIEIEERNDLRFDIPMFSVFAVDHLNWGLEWEKTKWEGFNKKNVPPSEAIHDYQYMLRMRNSPNLQKTKWGREVAIPYIEYGNTIAQHVEQTFHK